MKLVAKELRGAHIFLDMVSVGATINIMLGQSMPKVKLLLIMQPKNLKS